MFTEFSIHENFLKSRNFQDPNSSLAHDVFLNNWQNYGVLITHPGQIEKILNCVLSMPAKFKPRWQTALSEIPTYKIPDEMPDMDIMKNFDEAKALASFYSTLFLDEDLSYFLCGNDEIVRHCTKTGFELVGAPSLSASINIAKSVAACETDITSNDIIETIWSERFSKLAKHSKRIFISDRYVFKRLLDDIGRGFANTSIMKFFSCLLKEHGDYYITIASDGGKDQSQESAEIQNYFSLIFKNRPDLKSAIKRLSLISNNESVFQKHAHDRYIRFEKHVCEIGSGMTLFERHPLSNISFNIKLHHRTNSSAIERELREDPHWTAVITP